MTVREVAKAAGVSPITVSRVINEHPHVSKQTIRRVREAMDKLGHTPRLRSDRRRKQAPTKPQETKLGVFVLVVPDAHRGFYPSLHKGFGSQAAEFNHQVIVCSSNNDVGKQADIFLQLMDMNVAGVAVVPTTGGAPPTHQIRQLQSSGVPVVLLHRHVEGIAAPTLIMPYDQIGYRAGQELARHGHRRVACFFPERNAQVDLYESSFRRAITEGGGDIVPGGVIYGHAHTAPFEVHERGFESALRALLALPPDQRPTAIWASYDTQAELVYLLLARLEVRVPEQMSLLSFGGDWRNGPLAAMIDAVTVDECRAGTLAAKMLYEMHRGTRPSQDHEQLTIALGMHRAQTLAPPAVDVTKP